MSDQEKPVATDSVALALLDYRVGEVEKQVETMGRGLIEVDRKVNDIPGFIERKFDEQAKQIAARGKTVGDEKRAVINLILTAVAACGGLAGAAVTLLTHHQ